MKRGGETNGECICIVCGKKIPHQKGVPCRDVTCPGCGKKMLREGSYHHNLYIRKTGESDNESSSTNKR